MWLQLNMMNLVPHAPLLRAKFNCACAYINLGANLSNTSSIETPFPPKKVQSPFFQKGSTFEKLHTAVTSDHEPVLRSACCWTKYPHLCPLHNASSVRKVYPSSPSCVRRVWIIGGLYGKCSLNTLNAWEIVHWPTQLIFEGFGGQRMALASVKKLISFSRNEHFDA